MAMELGGGTGIDYDPDQVVLDAPEGLPPLLRAGDLVVRFFCVGEALSIPLIRGAWKASTHPLSRAVLARIVRDEAAHGTFGFSFLEWARPRLSEADMAFLGTRADEAIRAVHKLWDSIRTSRTGVYDDSAGDALGLDEVGRLPGARGAVARRQGPPAAARARRAVVGLTALVRARLQGARLGSSGTSARSLDATGAASRSSGTTNRRTA